MRDDVRQPVEAVEVDRQGAAKSIGVDSSQAYGESQRTQMPGAQAASSAAEALIDGVRNTCKCRIRKSAAAHADACRLFSDEIHYIIMRDASLFAPQPIDSPDEASSHL